ncbi:MAG: hypothetical protein GX962_13750, partial [Epulopiscium sp.]|nr:hypothetical protein [Candidatus Epulonipiscium sp.]
MRLRHLKEWMLLPEKEYIINQGVSIRGTDVQILSFTIEEDKNRLWLIYEQEDTFNDELEIDIESEHGDRIRTNREEELEKIGRNNIYKSFFINEMEIQDQRITFSSSSGSTIDEMNIESILKLQHFFKKGLIPDAWDDIRLKNLVIVEFGQSEDEDAPIIDNTRELDIKLNINPDSKEVLIQHSFKVKFGEQDKNTKITYFDEELKRENFFFINEIYSFDVYEYIEKQVEGIEDLEIREDTYNNLVETMERVYPRNKNLAVIKYETRDDIQLNFYMKDYLDRQQIDYNNRDSFIDGDPTISPATSVGFIWGFKEKG